MINLRLFVPAFFVGALFVGVVYGLETQRRNGRPHG